jgi:hypothetical protein
MSRMPDLASITRLTTVATLFIAGVFIDALVRRVRRQTDQSLQDAASMTAVVHSMQSVFGHASADATRAELCKTAREVAGCDFAVLWEPLANGSGIEASATDGGLGVSERLAFQSSHSGPLQAFVSGQVVFVSPQKSAEEEARLRVILERHGVQLRNRVRQLRELDPRAAQRRHRSPATLVDRVDRGDAESRRQHAVERRRSSAALDVAQHRRAGLEACALLDLVLEQAANPAEARMAELVDALGL